MTLRQARKIDKQRRGPKSQPHKIGTLFRVVARLRKSWRSGCPIIEAMGPDGRMTGADEDHADLFAANRVAVLAKRMAHARAGKWPAWSIAEETHGARRRLQ